MTGQQPSPNLEPLPRWWAANVPKGGEESKWGLRHKYSNTLYRLYSVARCVTKLLNPCQIFLFWVQWLSLFTKGFRNQSNKWRFLCAGTLPSTYHVRSTRVQPLPSQPMYTSGKPTDHLFADITLFHLDSTETNKTLLRWWYGNKSFQRASPKK